MRKNYFTMIGIDLILGTMLCIVIGCSMAIVIYFIIQETVVKHEKIKMKHCISSADDPFIFIPDSILTKKSKCISINNEKNSERLKGFLLRNKFYATHADSLIE